MTIDHIALWTMDLNRLSDFYIKYFKAKVDNRYRNPAKNFQSIFLSFDNGTRLELMHNTNGLVYSTGNPLRMGYTHMAISLDSHEAVDELTYRLQQDGYDIIGLPRVTGDGYYESVIKDPDGNRLEITSSKLPSYKEVG